MIVLIEHPDHGRMHVYSPEELKYHEGMGWRSVIQAVPKEEPKQNVVAINKKRGRPFKT